MRGVCLTCMATSLSGVAMVGMIRLMQFHRLTTRRANLIRRCTLLEEVRGFAHLGNAVHQHAYGFRRIITLGRSA